MSILRVNRSKTKYCVLHKGMITWNSLPDTFKVNVFIFNVQDHRTEFLSRKILENTDAGRHFDCIFF